MSADAETLLRWERQGGAWAVVSTAGGAATVALLRCDGGEEVDRVVLHDPDALDLVRSRLEESRPSADRA